MADPRVARWIAEYREIERKRKEQGLPPLTFEEARQQGFQDGMRDVRAVQNHALRSVQAARADRAVWRFSLRLFILFMLIAIGLATCGRIMLR